MKLSELKVEIKLDPGMDDDYSEAEEVLAKGFSPEYPIIIDEDGWILDGNHRYELFQKAGRLDELEFIMIDADTWFELADEEIENGTIDKYENDDKYFYKRIKEVA